MSVEAAVRAVISAVDRKIVGVSAFRATVTAVDGSLVQIRREGATTGNDEQYASCTRFLLAVGDVVLCIPLGLKPVVIDVIRRSASATPTFTALTAAGSTAVATSSAGDDTSGAIQLVPSGAGITTGAILDITWAVAKPSSSYSCQLTPGSTAARTLGMFLGTNARSTTVWQIATNVALTSGSTYVWHYHVRQYG